ncbi:WD40 containing snare-dependent exocytosis protein [Agrocybe pediades]|nr:WD40 containing snare-dependent exocytosis protein [Agrocybe pediades]
MFNKHVEAAVADLSIDLHDEFDWKVGSLRTFDFPLNVTSLAVDPVASLLAAGTTNGDIYIFGRPGVYCKISIPQGTEIRFLQFSVPSYRILCLDGNNQLHVYSLLEFGKPKLVHSARFDQINSITLSPSHTHVFLATQNGNVKTYDLTCLRKSPYIIPNLWTLYEDKMAADGIPALAPPSSPNAIDTVIHPRNLDLVFVAYEGGVILTDLTARTTIRAYELVLNPGAPGGSGYGAHDILTHRRMMVTCLAIHSSGHIMSVGYADGSIAFWAVEDDTKPLLVRTLDTVDVNLVDSDRLDSHMSGHGKTAARMNDREPIFKLSWSSFPNSSDPRSGETVLTVLGGIDSKKPPGLTVLSFPAFNPPEPPADAPVPQGSLHPFFRQAMCDSLVPKKSFYYETQGVVQDYLLIPRSSPHFNGSYDPYSFLLITERNRMRTVEAYQFPPPGFIQTAPSVPEAAEEQKDVDAQVETEVHSAGLLSPPPPPPLPKSPRHLNHTPMPYRIPVALLGGHAGILGGKLFIVSNDIYNDFVQKPSADDLFHLSLKGGNALADITKSNELKLSKYQPHRMLMTFNQDLSVEFFDISTQLLIPSSGDSVEQEWPEHLPGLSISPRELLDDPEFVEVLSSPVDNISVISAQIAPEGLECAIALSSGDLLVYHPASNRNNPGTSKVVNDAQITLLTHVNPQIGRRLAPYFAFTPMRGPVETFALADTGFLAVSYQDGSLFIIDLRGPRVIFTKTEKKSKRVSMMPQPHLPSGQSHGPDVVKSLTWTISPLDKDPRLAVRLIALHQSGHGDIYTLNYSGNPVVWNVAEESTSCKGMPDPVAGATFVFDANNGAPWRANRARLAASFKGTTPSGATPNASMCLMLTVGAKGARCSFGLNGEKVGKVEWGSKHGTVQTAQMVEHAESRALIVQTDRHDGLIYSIPHLERIHTVQLPPISSLPLSIDETGDFIAWSVSPKHSAYGVVDSATYGTFFDIRRAYTLPDIDFTAGKGAIPPQPQPVSLGPPSVLSAWFSFNQTKTGDQIDELLGGPDRPIAMAEKATAGAGGPGVADGIASTAAGFAASAAAVQASIYNKLSSAMNERGQLLGDLEERFSSLEEGSRSMVTQAKRLAAQQSAKTWFGF